jgi:uncharacterized protein YndB with AHSA1/START domain
MSRISTTATIRRPAAVVFDYVTTPGHWPEWHPSSLGVSGATDHSLAVGEQVTEHYRVAGREGTVVWTVRAREVPKRWMIEGTLVERAGSGTVAYTLTPREEATVFEREFNYPVPGLLLRLLDALIVRRRIQAESAEAVRRLQARLEATGSASHPA